MSQKRWPDITTSVSGISDDDWALFKNTAKRRTLTYRAAIEEAVADLIADIRSGHQIDWCPTRSARSKPIKIHNDTVEQIRELAADVDYRQNVVILTAMRRWCAKN